MITQTTRNTLIAGALIATTATVALLTSPSQPPPKYRYVRPRSWSDQKWEANKDKPSKDWTK